MHPESLSTHPARGTRFRRLSAPQVQVLDGSTASLLSAPVLPMRQRIALAGQLYAAQLRDELSGLLTGCWTWTESFWRD